jgi:hypothetical protein
MASATLALPATAAVPFYKIEAEHSGKALTISDLSTVNGEQVRQRTFVLGYWNHHWAKLPKDDGTYMFQARFSRQCMGVGGNWWQSGAPVIQQPCDKDNRSQRWILQGVRGFTYIENLRSHLVLTVALWWGSLFTEMAPVVQEPLEYKLQQFYRFTFIANG